MRILKITSLVVALFSLSFVLSGCSWDKSQPNVELIQDMMEQPSVKSQEYDDFFENGAGGARMPPEHTVPVGFTPYAYAQNPADAKNNKNPLAGNMSPEVLLVGQKYFETNCAVCHGHHLNGDGPVASHMPVKPPHLNSDKIKGWADGQIYNVITMGQGVMGPYASHIPEQDRWQVVNYIRYLQKLGNGTGGK
jgi:mono/diheme cytochrome c family protein